MTPPSLKYVFYGVLDQACKAATQNSAIAIMKNIAFILTVTNGWSMFYTNVISKGPRQALGELVFRTKSIASQSLKSVLCIGGKPVDKTIADTDNNTQLPNDQQA